MDFEWRLSKDNSETLITSHFREDSGFFFHERALDAGEPIPYKLLQQGWSVLQATCRYLHDELELSFAEIARQIDRDQRTVWTSYHQTKGKELPHLNPFKWGFPAHILRDRSLSALEAVVSHLLNQGLAVSAVATLLGRHVQTIWTIKRKLRQKGVET